MRNRSPSPAHHTLCETVLEETTATVEPVIRKWDLEASSTTYARISYLFRDYPIEAKQFLGCVNDLQRAMQFAVKQRSSSDLLVRAHNLMQIAVKRLQREFHAILSGNRYFLDPETVSSRSSRASSRCTISDSDDDLQLEYGEIQAQVAGISISGPVEKISDAVVTDLKSIATCMIGAGYGKECAMIYNVIRKSVVDETLYYLGVENVSSSQIQKMDWEVLEKKILNFQSAMKIAVRTLFLGERILCDEVFSASDHMRGLCFAEISKDGAINLFGFLESAAKYKKTSIEKVFRYFSLYEAVSDLWPEIETIFNLDSTAAVKSQAVTSVVKIGDAVRAMLSEFEAAMQKDSSKPLPGGGIHPLTRYVMNFLAVLSEYSGAVSEIIEDRPLPVQYRLPEGYFPSPTTAHSGSNTGNSTVSELFAWLVLVLLCKLDDKSRQYRDAPLSYLFLANNLNYVVSKVQNSNLNLILGSDWISKQEGKVKQFITNYERIGWSTVLTSEMEKNPQLNLSLLEVTTRITNFISGFEETCRKQSSWVIPDPELRDEVKSFLARKIVPGYRVLYETYRQNLHGSDLKVRFAPDNLHNYISDLFEGNGLPTTATTSYSPSSPSRLRGR